MTKVEARLRALGGAGIVTVLMLAGCAGVGSSSSASGPPSGSFTGAGPGTGAPGSSSASSGATGAGATPGPGASTGSVVGDTGSGGGQPAIRPGSLTAGAWDDNLNFDFFLKYLHNIESTQLADLPVIPRANRLEIRVTDAGGQPLGNVRVAVSGPGGKLFEAPTRPDGKLFFLPGVTDTTAGTPLQVQAAYGATTVTANAAVGDAAMTLALPGTTAAPARSLDIAIVIDTTGSMGDELQYLKVEVANIAAEISRRYPNVAQRLALILYRDDGDAYVVRSFDFTTSLATFQAEIDAQSSDGGGDYPEAPEKALARMTNLSWDPQTAARMAFWIGDAPHHTGREQMLVADILSAQADGVRIYPISASGTNELLEYSMRTAAQVTGGRYLFLTDDSRIGNDHKEPTIPCYVVTSLEKAMLRMISMELTGVDIQAATADVIRTFGNPQNGRCTLANGQSVSNL